MVLEILDDLRGVRPSPEATFLVRANLEEVIGRWLIVAPPIQITLHSSLSGDVEVAGPRTFFSRAMGNILRNATRHAHRELRISLSLNPAREVEIRIEDDGEGIRPEIRPHIFEPFVTGSGVGRGLGLSFARWGIERLGGRLACAEEPSILGGAVFRLTLPVSPISRLTGGEMRRSGDSRAQPPPSGSALEGLLIGVADDDISVRRTIARLLRRAGADVIELDPGGWPTAADAVRAIRRAAPDVLLLDLSLPHTSGLEVYEEMKDAAPEIARRVLFFTGGFLPSAGLDRPAVNKMAEWSELLASILRIVELPAKGS
jgi:CheY-like chemotaxis protein